MRERLARKLKSISTITNLKQGLVFQVNAADQCKELGHAYDSLHDVVPYKISLSELINNVEDEDFDDCNVEDEDFDQGFHVTERQSQACNLDKSEGILSNKSLAISEPMVIENSTTVKEVMDDIELHSSLSDFEEKCPPGGSDSVILYTTSLRGIRKTFEDCSTIRFLLESFRILYLERDVSMHMKFREELWKIMEGKIVPPRLFIRGRLIGGADEVVRLHEQGQLRKLLEGIPKTAYNCPCHGCAGVRFIVCVSCNGSRKMSVDDQSYENPVRCPDCNENGLVQCPICS